VVFDAATSFNSKTLNDALLIGPALQTQLPQVQIRFRERAIRSLQTLKLKAWSEARGRSVPSLPLG